MVQEPLYQQNPLGRFSQQATAYATHRPDYPAQVIDYILQGLGTENATSRTADSSLTAADVGAGTGISARLLGDRGVQVWAIEPNAAMLQAAQPHAQVQFQVGSAEATGLSDASVDLVTCFQSFHWFNPAPTLAEFHRILKPSGRLAIVWNDRDRTDPFTQHYSQLIKIASNHHPAESRWHTIDPLFNNALFTDIHHETVPHAQKLDHPGLIGLSLSVSYLPREGPVYDQLCVDLQDCYQHFRNPDGLVVLRYKTLVYWATAVLVERKLS